MGRPPPPPLLIVYVAQGATRTFAAFDAQRTGTIHLSYSQFVYAASNVL